MKAILVDLVLLLQLCESKLACELTSIQESLEQSNLAVFSAKLVAPWLCRGACCGVVTRASRASKNNAGISAWRRPAKNPATQTPDPTSSKTHTSKVKLKSPSIPQNASASAHKRQQRSASTQIVRGNEQRLTRHSMRRSHGRPRRMPRARLPLEINWHVQRCEDGSQ